MRESLPLIDNSKEIDCTTCEAACCKGPIILDMTIEEAMHMRRAGNELITVVEPGAYRRPNAFTPNVLSLNTETGEFFMEQLMPEHKPLEAGMGRYALHGDCKYLVEKDGWEQCGAYDKRPAVCQDFEVKSKKCTELRVLRGIDKPTKDTQNLLELSKLIR